MRNLLSALILGGTLFSVSNLTQADAGFGVSIDGDTSTIYIPINTGQYFRIEPSLSYFHRETTVEVYRESYNGYNYTSDQKSESTTIGFGLGLFGLAPFANQSSMYYGVRLGALQNKQTVPRSQSNGYYSYYSEENTRRTYTLSPTLGFEYSFDSGFSLGFETSLHITRSDDKKTNNDTNTAGTKTDIIARYFF